MSDKQQAENNQNQASSEQPSSDQASPNQASPDQSACSDAEATAEAVEGNETEADTEGGASAEVTATDLEATVAQLTEERDEFKGRMLQVAADFENHKRRARKDVKDAEIKAKERVLLDVLEVMDNLERAAASIEGASDVASIKEGVEMVLKQFGKTLERQEVVAVGAEGEPFDPHKHEAISQVPSADVPPGAVLSEVQKGYMVGERLLRPAKVVVALAPPEPAS